LKSEEESGKIESTVLPGRQKTVRFALDGTPIPEEAAPDAMDRSSLFRWAQITRITKFQRKVDPDEFQQVRRDLFTRRKLLRDRRRYAAAQEAVRPVEEKARFDDLFRSRIVKNRLARIAPSETPVRPSLSPSRRYSPSDSDRIRIRETQEPKELDNDQGSWEPETPTLLRAKSELPRSRGTSDIRDLIPERSAAETPAEHTANQASPAVAPAEKKTDAKVTPAKKEKPKAKKKSAAPPAQKKPIKASDASKKKQPDKQGKAQSAKKGTS
jgi:hypothetical protein